MLLSHFNYPKILTMYMITTKMMFTHCYSNLVFIQHNIQLFTLITVKYTFYITSKMLKKNRLFEKCKFNAEEALNIIISKEYTLVHQVPMILLLNHHILIIQVIPIHNHLLQNLKRERKYKEIQLKMTCSMNMVNATLPVYHKHMFNLLQTFPLCLKLQRNWILHQLSTIVMITVSFHIHQIQYKLILPQKN